MSRYSNGQYTSFQTSAEVLQAIEQLTQSSLLEENSDAYTLWSDGCVQNITAQDVKRLAWSFVQDDNEEYLVWGCKFYRSPPGAKE